MNISSFTQEYLLGVMMGLLCGIGLTVGWVLFCFNDYLKEEWEAGFKSCQDVINRLIEEKKMVVYTSKAFLKEMEEKREASRNVY